MIERALQVQRPRPNRGGLCLVIGGLLLTSCGSTNDDVMGAGGASAGAGGAINPQPPPLNTGGTSPNGSAGGMGPAGKAGGGTVASGGAPGATDVGAGGSSNGGAKAGGGGTGGDNIGGEASLGAPKTLSETGLFTQRGPDGGLVLQDGVREFQPKYWLWSDGTDKQRYVYLPPGTQIDTSDPDHWVMPVGSKLWKSFIADGQLVETRLIERSGAGPDDYLFATYYWRTADAMDAGLEDPLEQRRNAAGTQHDIPSSQMCERCHNPLKDRALGFSALQLNHDRGGLNLETLMAEGRLTDPISLDIRMPGDDPITQDALGYLHANCGNCHNDSPGLKLESVPAPQMLLRVLVNDKTLEDTGVFQTAINQKSTASKELGIEFRVVGGDVEESALHFRMTQRQIEDQMPPLGTEHTDPAGLAMIKTWIESLPPPP